MAPNPRNIAGAAQRANNIVALLEYKPSPGIYSRLEQAVQGLPENVRVQELPGLLKRYKDGIPGWELKAVDLDSVIAGRDVVPRDELLAAVRERSPVYTHKEVVLGGKPQQGVEIHESEDGGFRMPVLAIDRQQTTSPLGAGVSHGQPKYENYGQGGDDYSEVLLIQPGQVAGDYGNHWKLGRMAGSPEVELAADRGAVAHLRFDTHGDALRINELQSDLGIHNRKAREHADNNPQIQFGQRLNPPEEAGRDFPLEDAWADILTKRAVLEAARQGHRAIEVASPRSIADKVGGNIDNYEHFYGKVLPGSLERLGRKMGGMVDDTQQQPQLEVAPGYWDAAKDMLGSEISTEAIKGIRQLIPPGPRPAFGKGPENIFPMLVNAYSHGPQAVQHAAHDLYAALAAELGRGGVDGAAEASRHMPGLMRMAEQQSQVYKDYSRLQQLGDARAVAQQAAETPANPPRRYIMSDEMRKNIITKGIPAAVAIGAGTGIATGGSEAEAKPLGVKGRGVDGYTQTSWGLKAPGPSEEKLIRSLVKPGERRQVEQLTKQLDEAYATQDFGRVDDLEAQREQLLENLDSRLSQTTEDTEADFADWEPNDYEGDAKNYEEQMRDIYASYVSGGPHFETEADLANALRGVGPDTEKASRASDADLIQEAKAVFEARQAQIEKVKAGSPEDGVRAMQAKLRDMPAGLAAAPIMGQAQSVNENRELPTGSGGSLDDIRRGLVGEADFSMGISPAEWFAHQQAQKTDGVSAEHQKFQQNIADVMGRPIIRVGAANDSSRGPRLAAAGEDYDRITPAQFVGEYLDRFASRMDEAGRGEVLSRVMSRLDGTNLEPDGRVDDIVGRMMDSLKESSPKGKYAKMDPMPQEQLDALKQQHGDWAESMLTPGTAENFDSLRGYELLRTTLDGQHAPVYADNLSNAMTFASGLVDGDSRRDFQDLTFSSGPEGRFSRANRDYFRSAAREGEPAAFRDQDGTSRFASTGMNNVQGLMRAGGDTSNAIGAASQPLYNTFSEFTRTAPGKLLTGQVVEEGPSDSEFMAARGQAFDREQPIQPAGMSREMFDRQLANHQQDREQGLAWGATTYPNVQQFFGGDKAQKTWGPPAYNDYGPNFLQNTVGNIPSAGIMAASAATGGVAGLAAGAFKPTSSSVRSLINAGMGLGRGTAKGVGAAAASQAADLPFDTATDLGVGSTLAGPGNYLDYMTTPEQENALLPGVDPNSMSIEQLNDKRQNALYDRDTTFRDDKLQWFNRKNDRERAYDQWRNSR